MNKAKCILGTGLISKFGLQYDDSEGERETKKLLADALIVMRVVRADGLAHQINPFLFIGSIGCAYNQEELMRCGITHIVCATRRAKNKFSQTIRYHRVNIEDSIQEDITPMLEPFIAFVDTARLSDETNKILVHCFQGKSRACSLCIAYMMHRVFQQSSDRKYEVENLFYSLLDLVRACRPIVCPNESFKCQIIAYFQDRL